MANQIKTTVTPVEAQHPLVLALDVGTSSVRAELYDLQGRRVEGIKGRTPYRMNALPDGGVEIEADRLIEIILSTIDVCLSRAGVTIPKIDQAIGCVGYSNFWHAMLGVDKQGRAITPLYNWNDTRSAEDAKSLAEKFGIEWIHQRTGVVPHASYYPAKVLWLRRTNPDLFSKVDRWVSIGEYLYRHIFGRFECGISMASGTGLFNPNQNRWDEEMLKAIELETEKLSPIVSDCGSFDKMKPSFEIRWPALKQAKWLHAAGDGACSNIGSGCYDSRSIAINVGTSGAMRVCWPAQSVTIPDGLWCYRANRDYALIGGALSNGGDVYDWCSKTLNIGAEDSRNEDDLELKIDKIPADSHGLTVLPFFSGERSTGWHDFARASIIGISLSTRPVDILRASLESVCYRFAAIYDRLKSELADNTRIIASGGALVNSPLWTQMMADVIGVPVAGSAVPEASSRGAAILALKSFGYIEDFNQLVTPVSEIFRPNAENHAIYLLARARQEKFYDLIIANKTNLH